MLKIEKTEVLGTEAAIRGMRNPLESWSKSDSVFEYDGTICEIGENDLSLMKRLSSAGKDHRKYLRMIHVQTDITAPLYWWKEFDTYKVGTVANSCSTMHTIHKRDLTIDDFSHEHLSDEEFGVNGLLSTTSEDLLRIIVEAINYYRRSYVEDGKSKDDWWQMIQLLPSSFNQKRTVDINYEVLAGMYFSRKDHKLDEWHTLCDWMKTLPYFEEIVINPGK